MNMQAIKLTYGDHLTENHRHDMEELPDNVVDEYEPTSMCCTTCEGNPSNTSFFHHGGNITKSRCARCPRFLWVKQLSRV